MRISYTTIHITLPWFPFNFFKAQGNSKLSQSVWGAILLKLGTFIIKIKLTNKIYLFV